MFKIIDTFGSVKSNNACLFSQTFFLSYSDKCEHLAIFGNPDVKTFPSFGQNISVGIWKNH